ncbi:hypothetical protein LINGRAHAP2_LOCUS11335 [Linum grandiflorum]
MLGKQG